MAFRLVDPGQAAARSGLAGKSIPLWRTVAEWWIVRSTIDKNESSAPQVRFPPRILLILLLVSLPLLNPWVRGDGVGYYAFARAPLTQHNLDFAPDYARTMRMPTRDFAKQG